MPSKVKRVVSEFGATAVAPGRDLRPAGRHLRALRARRHDQRRHAAAAQGGDRRRRRQQPARRGAPRRRSWRARGILYAPDYVINAGGVINVYGELTGWPARALAARRPARSTTRCSASSRSPSGTRIPTYRAADRLAEQRIAAVAGWTGSVRACGRCGDSKTLHARRGSACHPSTASHTLSPWPNSFPSASDHAGFELKERLDRGAPALGLRAARPRHPLAPSRPTMPTIAHPVARRVEQRRGASAGSCSAAPGSACRTPRTGIRACARRWRGRPRSPSWRASTTTPTCWCCRRGS